jgi:8-oxo-dGTP pyrophosphatase MutT (NUDIX family)
MRLIKSAGVIIFRETPELQFLLLWNAESKNWQFPRGHLEESENEFIAAKREVQEETSICNLDFEEGFKRVYQFTTPKHVARQITLFLAKTKQEPKISEEHHGYCWVNINELTDFIKYPEQNETVNEIFNHFNRL